jgi:hypothetical protein
MEHTTIANRHTFFGLLIVTITTLMSVIFIKLNIYPWQSNTFNQTQPQLVTAEKTQDNTKSWQSFLKHFSSNGFVSMSRQYTPENPYELYRLTALVSQSLTESGISEPQNHMMIFSSSDMTGYILVNPKPLTKKTIQNAEKYAKKLHFSILYVPTKNYDPTFSELIIHPQLKNIEAQLTATDSTKHKSYLMDLSIWVTLLTLLSVIPSLMLSKQKTIITNNFRLVFYFAFIGFGFMYIVISLLQQLVLFLGPQTNEFSIVAFSILTSCGLGTLFVKKASRDPVFYLSLILIMLGGIGYTAPHLIQDYESSLAVVRIIIATAILFPAGFCMGFAFPIGMQIARAQSPDTIAWFTNINGAASICGSILAMLFAFTIGASTTYWLGVGFYLLAFLAYVMSLYQFLLVAE